MRPSNRRLKFGWIAGGATTSMRFLASLAAMLALSCTFVPPVLAQDAPPVPHRAPETPPPSPVDPLAPKELVAMRAFDVLNRHCARCHDHRRLQGRPLPALPIAEILDLDRLAARHDLVQAGRPEASPLYVSMVTRHMPFDVFQELEASAGSGEPTAADIVALRDWIASLASPQNCEAQPGRWTELAATIKTDLASLSPKRAKQRRYLSLYELAPVCGTAEDKKHIDAYRQAATKLLNLVSLANGPMRLEPLGEDGRVLAFDLNTIGWAPDRWNLLASRYGASAELSAAVIDDTGSKPIVLPAHWLAHEIAHSGNYDTLLGIPRELKNMLAIFGVDGGAQDAASTQSLSESAITGGARILNRYQTSTRHSLWLGRDFSPSSNPSATDPLQSRVIFPLPNGFPGFATYGMSGELRQSVHKDVLPNTMAGTGAKGSGLSCLLCHSGGASADTHPVSASGAAQASPSSLLTKRDRDEAALAFQIAGIDPNLRIDAIEPVMALAGIYARDLDLAAASAELGRSPQSLSKQLRALDGPLQPVARRLTQGLVSRKEFEGLRRALQGEKVRSRATAPVGPSPLNDPPRLSLWSDKSIYDDGEPVILHAATSAPCHLTLISIDQRGDAAVIFPNDFAEDNKLTPGKELTVPAKDNGFVLRKETSQPEKIVGICMAGDRKSPPGIYHDFEIQHFTLLGPWQEHLVRALEADTAERKNAGEPVKKKKKPRRRRYHKKPELPFRPDRLPLAQSWAEITLHGRPAIPVSAQD